MSSEPIKVTVSIDGKPVPVVYSTQSGPSLLEEVVKRSMDLKLHRPERIYEKFAVRVSKSKAHTIQNDPSFMRMFNQSTTLSTDQLREFFVDLLGHRQLYITDERGSGISFFVEPYYIRNIS